ncbi:hypothetical protein JCM16358_23100 [Halanaerocella petrolearia]
MADVIRITSKKEGFRRCGVAHSSKPQEYPGDKFSKEELKQLESEPMLVVEKLEKKKKSKGKGKSKGKKK